MRAEITDVSRYTLGRAFMVPFDMLADGHNIPIVVPTILHLLGAGGGRGKVDPAGIHARSGLAGGTQGAESLPT